MTQEEVLIAYKAGALTITEVLEKFDEFKQSLQIPKKQEKQKKFQSLIFKNVLSPLSSVPYHHDIECIERYCPNQFPTHLAIHRINDAKVQERNYTELHSHKEQEINIIISDKDQELVYEIQLDTEVYYVKSNSSIWIPSGMPHLTNVVKGSGFFIALRLNADVALAENYL